MTGAACRRTRTGGHAQLAVKALKVSHPGSKDGSTPVPGRSSPQRANTDGPHAFNQSWELE